MKMDSDIRWCGQILQWAAGAESLSMQSGTAPCASAADAGCGGVFCMKGTKGPRVCL
ncbi:hypothetical protein NDS46_26770 [Paenibacillus thiaminolyticus]|uniref:hypothetical protein n=1 Tax=Paenibacillus thiaminolyticus TaxID=49283 RepID=UPI00232EB4FE|nr:hypothetical protein [Paenibacillus thiaminolyticus]WCF07834.1 hypothetical protein NDS46_26770 [Paenibacillus thiaminolyticus]